MTESFIEKKFRYLTLIAFLIFLPQISSAQSLGMLGSPSGGTTVPVNQPFPITATTSDNKQGVVVTFRASDTNGTIINWVTFSNGGQCTTDSTGRCVVNVTATTSGSFYLAASATGYQSAVTGSTINAAPSVSLSASPSSVPINQDSTLTARTSDSKQGVSISFSGATSISGLPSLISSPTCATSTNGSCTITFKSPQAGSFRIKANATGYHSSFEVTINVTSGSTTPPPPIPPVPEADTNTYVPLAPLPNPENPGEYLTSVDVGGPTGLSTYINYFIKLIIGLAAVLAVVMIVWGGIEYMMTELIPEKAAAKKRITEAVLGLLLALGSWLILSEINPNLLGADVQIDTATIQAYESQERIVTTQQEINAICGKTVQLYGQTVTSCNDSEMVWVDLMGKKVQVNKVIVPDIGKVNFAWQNTTDPKIRNYLINSIGGYNPRAAVGTTQILPSAHAFGLAVDINPSTNPYVNAPSPCVTDMNAAFVNMFTSRRFGWGGYWITKKDAMHFSLLPAEVKYTSGTCDGLRP